MDNAVSMLKLQADLIDGEVRILDLAAAACESNGLRGTARALRLSLTILRNGATLIRKEADQLEGKLETVEPWYDLTDTGNQGS